MLIELSVANFYSFRERQTFSMVAAPRIRTNKQNTFATPILGERLPDLLKAAVVYGPNASGKTNLVRVFQFIDMIANRGPDFASARLPVVPFRFDRELASRASAFELNFACGGLRYELLLEATPERITRERLTAYPKGRTQLLYDRVHADGADQYAIGALEGGASLHDVWKKITAPRTLFMAQVVANSSEEFQQLRRPFSWLQNAFYNVRSVDSLAEQTLKIARVPAVAEQIASFLRDVDVPVQSIRIEKPQTEGTNRLLVASEPTAKASAVFTHRTALGDAELAFHEESEGTQNLIGFWLPWSTREPGSEKDPCILVVDEFDSSLHPLIVATLVRRHMESDTPSQLIFTTHDTHLMDSGLLRRDQIWLTERDANGATQLRSIHDFEGREGEDIEKRYFEGRYRALPLVSR